MLEALLVASMVWIGPAEVIDGDTIDVRGVRIRLHGIDAPEMRQMCTRQNLATGHQPVPIRCGVQSKRALETFIDGREVRCELLTKGRYGRWIATCYSGTVELSAAMVRFGWAYAYRKYTGRYIELEEAADRAKVGHWAGDFLAPWVWRAEQRKR